MSPTAAPGSRLSGLTTRGRCLIAGGAATAACAVVLDERDLLRLGLFIVVLPLLGALLAARTRRAVRVRRRIAPDRLSVGSDGEVTLHVRGGPVLGPLRLTDVVSDAAGARSDQPPRFVVHRLTPRAPAALTYPLRPVLRGVHRIGPVTAEVTDPLGLAEFAREVAPVTRLLVLPRIVPLSGMPPALGGGEGAHGADAGYQGHGRSDVLVRPYQHGDELRRVHWPSTARHDELIVRHEERPWRGGITVLLDRRECAHRGRGAAASLEFAVSMAGSVYMHLLARGEPVSLVTEDGTPVPPDAVRQTGADPVLDALATLRPSAVGDLAGPAMRESGGLLAVLGAVAPADVDALVARRPGVGVAVLLDTATWGPAAEGRAGMVGAAAVALRRAGWQAVLATVASRPEQVWDELTAAAAVLRAGAP